MLPVKAQQTEMSQQRQNIQLTPELKKDNNFFNHMDLGVTLGTTGLGFEVRAYIQSIPFFANNGIKD